MEERMMRRVADSAVIQTQLVLNSHLNGAGRLFGGQLMEWIDIVATVVARRHAHCNPTTAAVDNLQFKEAVHLNNTLIIEGKLTYVGRTSMEVRVDTFVESLSGARKLETDVIRCKKRSQGNSHEGIYRGTGGCDR